MFAVCIGKSEPFPLKTALALPRLALPRPALPCLTAPRLAPPLFALESGCPLAAENSPCPAQPRPAVPRRAESCHALPRHAETHKTKLTAPSATFHETGARQAHQIQLSTRP